MRVAVIGATGQLGSDIVRVFRDAGDEVFALGHGDIECTDSASVQAVLTSIRPDVVINCAAFVRVDDCEDYPEKAFQVNALGARNVAQVCGDLNAVCVYISTDYVFDGVKGTPYTEEDAPGPVNVYGASKLAGEFLVRSACPDSLVVRTASLFGLRPPSGKGRNFVETILAKAQAGEVLRVVHDIRMSPTFSLDAAHAIERLIHAGQRGIVHVTNRGACSWYEFARAIVEYGGLAARIEPISSGDYPMQARRPRDSSLASHRLPPGAAAELREWEEALRAYRRVWKEQMTGERVRGSS